jgi:RHS repeat-associated protein
MGRVEKSRQTTDGTAYNQMEYVYNLSGAMIEEKYPSGRIVRNTLDNDGDLQQVQSQKANGALQNYANSFNYTAAGAVSSMRLGNGRWENTTFNSRLQPTQIGLGSSATSQNLLKLDFDYGTTDNNGNIKSQQITVPTIGATAGFTAIQTYTYDSLNRIKDAKELIGATQQWKQTFLYDRYGNRRFDTANNNTTTLQANCQIAVCNPTIDPATNKLIGYQFDSSGNTKVDAENRQFIYDAENKQVEVRDSANNIVGKYFYDGDGKRVKKISATETTIFVYNASGQLVAEYSTQTAQAQDAKVSYLTNDHLGSPRITTDANGQVISRRDFLPFGEEISRANYGTDSVRQKFTGYQRDEEIDEDFAEARYYNYKIGRFNSVDPLMASADINSPQTLNRYSYVMNNPLNLTDPTGMIAGCPEGQTCQNDDAGKEYYINTVGAVVYTGAVATVVTVGVKEAVKEVIVEPSWWEMAWYKIKKGGSAVGRKVGGGVSALGRGLGVIGQILISPPAVGCSGLGETSDGNGGCVRNPNYVDPTMSDESEPDVEKDANPDTDNDAPSGTKNKKDKKKKTTKKSGKEKGNDIPSWARQFPLPQTGETPTQYAERVHRDAQRPATNKGPGSDFNKLKKFAERRN